MSEVPTDDAGDSGNDNNDESECSSPDEHNTDLLAGGPLANHLPTPLLAGALRLDIRPEECNSFFDYHSPIARGSAIEDAVALHEDYATATPTVQWFPSIDFTRDGTAIVQVSRDLTAATYINNPAILHRLLLEEADNLQDNFITPLETTGFVTAEDNADSTTIAQSEVSAYRIELIVQQGRMTAPQSEAIRQAAIELASAYGITLQVIEIP